MGSYEYEDRLLELGPRVAVVWDQQQASRDAEILRHIDERLRLAEYDKLVAEAELRMWRAVAREGQGQ